jgi:putative tricarboxylic transport membrane protein
MPPSLRRGWLIATAAMLVLCLFALWQSSLLAMTDRLGPGPGFIPFWLAILGAGFALALLFDTFRTPASTGSDDDSLIPKGDGARRVASVLIALVLVTLTLELLGFQIALFLFSAGLVIALGERRWLVILLFAAGGSFGVYYLFTRWLDVLLPAGRLFG